MLNFRQLRSFSKLLWIRGSINKVHIYISTVDYYMLTMTAEAELLKIQQEKPAFSLSLLQIVASESFPLNTRLSSALCFKNYIRFNYVVSPVAHSRRPF